MVSFGFDGGETSSSTGGLCNCYELLCVLFPYSNRSHKNDIDVSILDMLLAMDNFLEFKALMLSHKAVSKLMPTLCFQPFETSTSGASHACIACIG